ncbi:PRC-barrel domain-containing protein [Chelativorans sp. Marseille-P2723]|uniref:PRC-barrel domain-containing protein n=1 Tax=Chelativorans sp. Marseille-P2723 TaxID=2709133 RepID=UPI00156FEC9E|nr:PRC-barrel domain-containing protein [Chelativorans sp. Marseille-P2723]
MLTRCSFLTLSVLTASLFAGAAIAQSSWVEVEDDVMVPPFEAVADDVDDWDVYSSDGTKIGEVEDVVGPDNNTPTALVIDFEDDAGYGDRDDVIVPLDSFEWNGERLVLNLEPSEVTDLEVYDD